MLLSSGIFFAHLFLIYSIMRYIKVFEEFEDIDSLCQKYGIENYTVVDGLVNVDGDVDLRNKSLTKIPIKFGHVSGGFYCNSNKLTSLEGAPQSVGSDFDCHSNKLTSLEGAPQIVGGGFYCHSNKLVSLEGAPNSVSGIFFLSGNPVQKIWQLFTDKSKIDLLNYYDPIRLPENADEKPTIIIDRLNQFLEDIGKEPVEEIKGYNCI